MEVMRCINCVLIFMIELAFINLEFASIIVIIMYRCQMFQAYDGTLLNQVVIFLAYDSCVLYMYIMTKFYTKELFVCFND